MSIKEFADAFSSVIWAIGGVALVLHLVGFWEDMIRARSMQKRIAELEERNARLEYDLEIARDKIVLQRRK